MAHYVCVRGKLAGKNVTVWACDDKLVSKVELEDVNERLELTDDFLITATELQFSARKILLCPIDREKLQKLVTTARAISKRNAKEAEKLRNTGTALRP